MGTISFSASSTASKDVDANAEEIIPRLRAQCLYFFLSVREFFKLSVKMASIFLSVRHFHHRFLLSLKSKLSPIVKV